MKPQTPQMPTKNKTAYIIIVVAMAIIFVLGMMAIDKLAIPKDEIVTRVITNTFIDVNEDGMMDFVKYAEVIINENKPIVFP